MPKLVNFNNRVEIDGVPYRKNEIKPVDGKNEFVSIHYSKEADPLEGPVPNISQQSFADWTDENNVAYTSKEDLLNDLKEFIFRFNSETHTIEVAQGNIPGETNVQFNAFGTVGASDFQDIWNAAGDLAYPIVAGTWEVVSDSVLDTAAGTGGRTVQITTLDINYNPVIQTVTLNGTTPVSLTGSLYRPNTMDLLTAGSTRTNQGNVTLSEVSTGNTMGVMPFNSGESFSSHFSVPAGKTFFSLGTSAYVGKGEDLFIRAISFGPNSDSAETTGGIIRLYQQAFAVPGFVPLVAPEKTNIRFQGITSQATARVTIITEFRLIDN